eukprot:2335136-Rhodomonas_salina.1
MARRSHRVAEVEDALAEPPTETEAQRQQRKATAREVKLRNREDLLKKAEEQRVSAAAKFACDEAESDAASVGAGEEGGASATA